MKLANINRDYMVIIDVKSGSVNKPTMVFYNTDKNTSNIYAQLVVKETIVAATPIENATDYSVELKVVKPGSIVKFMDGTLVNEAEAIYEFDLPEDFTNLSGNYDIEFWVKAKVNNRDEMITSSKAKYTVKPSILTDLDEAIEDHDDYPLFLKLMEEVKVINETAHELDTTIRTLQADMIEANNEMKTNEATRQANEATRVANEVAREEAEAIREGQETTRVADESERKASENQRKANEEVRTSNEVSRVAAENARKANEEIRQTNETNREAAEAIRRTNEEARISEHEAMRTEHEQTMTAVNEVKAENAILMENDKKQADRMTQVEISDKRQYVIMEGLMNSAGDGYLKIEDTGNDTTLYNSVEGFVDVKNITGNTMVNSIKNPDDEFTLNGDINTSGQSVTLTTAVNNGQVDVLAEGNTMVNVCDQQEAVAITKSYTVETGNHIALQGEFDGKARPVPTGNTLVNLVDCPKTHVEANGSFINIFTTGDVHLIKPNTDYTFIVEINNLVDINSIELNSAFLEEQCFSYVSIANLNNGIYTVKATSKSDLSSALTIINTRITPDSTTGSMDISIMLLEGDYTNKPIPDYFSGMKSSFEDKVVTQEMVDSGKELAENLGKYKVETKVVGKNKFDKSKAIDGYEILNIQTGLIGENSEWFITDYIPVIPNTKYTISGKANSAVALLYDSNKNTVLGISSGCANGTITIPSNARYIRLNGLLTQKDTFQLEEGETATAYEPYKESIKTYYLNSPLLEGDTIEESGGNVYHVHRSEIVAYTEGDESTNITDLTNTLKTKSSPTKELISQNDTILTDSYVSGHLDFDTAVPVEKVDFNRVSIGNKYLYPSTNYNIQFESDRKGNLRMFFGGGATEYNGDIIQGINKLTIKTGDTQTSKLLYLDGIGFNASNIVVTEATDKDFGYFQGMKSVGELEENKIEILSQKNKNLLDKTTIIPYNMSSIKKEDGWYVCDDGDYGGVRIGKAFLKKGVQYYLNFEYENISNSGWWAVPPINTTDYAYLNGNVGMSLPQGIGNKSIKLGIPNEDCYIDCMLVRQGVSGIIKYRNASITTEPTTTYIPHASNKKEILLNEPLRAVGDTKDRFVQIDGKWYVERNCAERNYETDDETNTSYKTDKVKTVYALTSPTYEPVEIAPTVNTYTDVTHITNNSTIPMNMNIKNSGYEIIAKPSTKYTVVGINNGRIGDSTIVNGTITTPATITDNFLRPYGTGTTIKVMLLEGEPANIPGYFKGIKSVFEDKVTDDGKYACEVRVYNDLGNETVQTLYLDEPLYNTNNITIYNDKLGYWKNYDIRDYQDGDFGTYLTDMTKTVYQLAEPVFVSLIDNCPNWIIGSWDNCSIHFDSIIPLSATRYRYTGNVPSVVAMSNDVAEAKSISDEQDSLIVDLATEVAVMKMTM